MRTEEIVKLTPEALAEVLSARHNPDCDYDGPERRQHERWPFPGTAELRLADDPSERLWFATCRDLNESGMGLSCECYFDPGATVEISIHLPEATLYGQAMIRYCTKTPRGYMTGVEFTFE